MKQYYSPISKFNLLFLWLFILCPFFANAQWMAGVKAGTAYNQIYTPKARGYSNPQSATGYHLGLLLEYRTDKNVALRIEPSWVQKGYGLYSLVDEYPILMTTVNFTHDYLSLPLVARFYMGKNHWKPFIDVGMDFSYWISGKAEGIKQDILSPDTNKNVPYSEKYRFDSRRDRRTENALLTGAGINYEIKRHNFSLEARYALSLTDIYKHTEKNISKRNRTLLFSLGYMYQL